MRLGLIALAASVVAACASDRADSDSSSIPLRAPSASAAATALPKPVAKAMCETTVADDHFCLQLDDDELVREYEESCKGRMVKEQGCPLTGVSAVCRLPDGSLRFGYPPKTPAYHEKVCKSMQGKHKPGEAAPAPDEVVVISCEGKFEQACEEEEVHVSSRIQAAAEECKDFGGVHHVGAGCSRDKATFTCDLKGKRMVVGRSVSSFDARKRFCDERRGSLLELDAAAAPASASAAPSNAPVDLDPPEATPDVRIRQE